MSAGALALGMASCENGDATFPDYEGGISVYFPYQYPIRTITLGDISTYDNSRENDEHKFTIYGTMGGSYTGKDIKVNVQVDESLIEGLTFEDGTPLKMLPSDYFQLSGNTLDYGGKFMGGVDVQLNDAFFADPASAKNTYVIPLLMTSASGADHIISTGTPIPGMVGQNPARTDVESWISSPKDFTIYCVNFINKYDGNYLRRGTDDIVKDGKKKVNGFIKIVTGNQTEHPWDNQFWIKSTENLRGASYEIKMKIKAEKNMSVGTQLHFGTGGYQHWNAIGNVDFTTEWTEFTKSGKFDENLQMGGDVADCIAFNLNIGQDGFPAEDANTFYFDDISLIINGEEVIVNGNCDSDDNSSYASKVNIGDNSGEVLPSTFDGIFEDIKGTSTNERKQEFVENDEVIKVTTKTLNSVTIPVKVETAVGTPVTCHLLLTFDGDNCTITVDPDSESATKGYTATGTGEFKSKSEKLAWGNKDRDGLYLNYTINLGDCKYTTQDVLVARDRGKAGSVQTFKPIYTKN
jgi:hypothetical protein